MADSPTPTSSSADASRKACDMDFDVDCGVFVPSQTRSLKNKISRDAARIET